MVDAGTCEVGLTLAPRNKESWNDVWKKMNEKYATFVMVIWLYDVKHGVFMKHK
jgi:hypothetical protein